MTRFRPQRHERRHQAAIRPALPAKAAPPQRSAGRGGRLPWPLAAAVIGVLSLAAWGAIAWLVLHLSRG